MIRRNQNLIGNGATLFVIGLVAVMAASIAVALIKAAGYVVMIAGIAVIVAGLVKRWKRPRHRRTMA